MNRKRIAIATTIGLLCGLYCAYAASQMENPATGAPFGIFILLSIVYNRALIGFVIGIADGIKLHPVLRGAILGAIVSFVMTIPAFEQGTGALILVPFGVVYGIIADFVATKFS
ncbi:hypothetical protein DRN97_04050 [Methanosarcinales archaeon]|nr:MAG: hypothetical protein DRN97_04050 [Methanosarcinales archaeon]